jgi:hypothetical protein
MKHATNGARWLIIPALVTVMDALWGWTLSTYAKPWFFELLKLPHQEASQYFDNTIEPRQWIGYAIVLAAQLAWVNVIMPRPLSRKQLSLFWWLGCMTVIVASIVLRQGLGLSHDPALLLLGVQIGDVVLLYWLATRLMTPMPQRKVIPGWW